MNSNRLRNLTFTWKKNVSQIAHGYRFGCVEVSHNLELIIGNWENLFIVELSVMIFVLCMCRLVRNSSAHRANVYFDWPTHTHTNTNTNTQITYYTNCTAIETLNTASQEHSPSLSQIYIYTQRNTRIRSYARAHLWMKSLATRYIPSSRTRCNVSPSTHAEHGNGVFVCRTKRIETRRIVFVFDHRKIDRLSFYFCVWRRINCRSVHFDFAVQNFVHTYLSRYRLIRGAAIKCVAHICTATAATAANQLIQCNRFTTFQRVFFHSFVLAFVLITMIIRVERYAILLWMREHGTTLYSIWPHKTQHTLCRTHKWHTEWNRKCNWKWKEEKKKKKKTKKKNRKQRMSAWSGKNKITMYKVHSHIISMCNVHIVLINFVTITATRVWRIVNSNRATGNEWNELRRKKSPC